MSIIEASEASRYLGTEELRQGSVAQSPENFEVFALRLHIPPSSTFGNREQFSDQFLTT